MHFGMAVPSAGTLRREREDAEWPVPRKNGKLVTFNHFERED